MQELFDACIDKWGVTFQEDMAIEEMAECILAIQHFRRGRIDLTEFAGEIADVEIMMGQMRRVCGEATVDAIKASKLARLADRVAGRLPVQHTRG